jgi:hypothetical protein
MPRASSLPTGLPDHLVASTSRMSSCTWKASPTHGAEHVPGPRAAAARPVAHCAAISTLARISAPVLSACRLLEVGQSVSVASLRGEVEGLSAGHAAGAARDGERGDDAHPDGGIAPARPGAGEQLKASTCSESPARMAVASSKARGRSAGRGAGRRRPWPAGRRAPANSMDQFDRACCGIDALERQSRASSAVAYTRAGRMRLPGPSTL